MTYVRESKTMLTPLDALWMLDTTSVANLPDMGGSGAVRDLKEAANDVEWRVAA